MEMENGGIRVMGKWEGKGAEIQGKIWEDRRAQKERLDCMGKEEMTPPPTLKKEKFGARLK